MRVGAYVGLAILVSACSGIADAEQLAWTTWTVAEIDGEPVPDNELWLYLDVNTAELVTQPQIGNRNVRRHCRAGTAELVYDTDGHAFNFGDFVSGAEGRCDPGMLAWHDRIAGALRENQRWEASGDSLYLVGSSRVRLTPQGSD